MADVATIALELDSSGLQRGVREAEEALRKLKGAGDQVGQSQQQAGRGTASAGKEMAAAAREANAYLQATARLQRAYGDYSGAVATLNTQLKGLTATSSQYVRVQAQIAQIQAQAGRVARGESFAGFAQSLKGIQGQLGELQKFSAVIANLPGLGGAGQIAGRVGGIASAIESVAASASPATVVIGALGASFLAAGAGAIYGAKQLIEFGLAGARAADNLTDLATILGLQPAFLQRLGVAYALAGKDISSAQAAITKFEGVLGQAASGNAPQLAKALASIGLNAKTAGADTQASLTQVLDILSRSTDQTKVAAVATELFGRKGLELVGIYRDLSNANSDLNQQLTKYGLLVGGDVLTKAGKLADAQDIIAKRMEVLSIIVAAKLSPVLIKLSDDFLTAFVKAEPAIVAVTGALGGILGALGSIARFLSDHPILARILAGPTLQGITGGLIGPLGLAGGASAAGGGVSTVAASHGGSADLKVGALASDLRAALSGPKPSPGPLDSFLDALKKQNVRGGAGGAGVGGEKISEATQALLNFIDTADKLGRQSLPQTIDTIVDAQRDIDTLSAKLNVLSAAGLKTAQITEQLAKAQETLRQAQDKFFKETGDALTKLLGKVALAQQTGPPPGVPVTGNIPGVGGATDLAFKRGFDGIADAIRKAFREGSGGQQQFNGPIPGQFNPGEAPAPNTIQSTESAAFKAEARRAGKLITQDFLTGALLGQADAKRAGEQIAFFFADYAARKMTDALSKQLDKAFDFLAGIIGNFIQRIVSGIGGGGGGLLGNIAGTLAGAAFGGLKLPIHIGPNSAGSLIGTIPHFAGGGFAGAGSMSLVGENGPELFIPQAGGWIVNRQQAGAAGGGGMNVTMNFNISAPNGQVDRRSIDQMSENALFALSRAQRNRGA